MMYSPAMSLMKLRPAFWQPARAVLALAMLISAGGLARAELVLEYDFANEFEENGNEQSMASSISPSFSASGYNSRSNSFTLNQSGISTIRGTAFMQVSATPEGLNTSTSDAFHSFQLTVDENFWDITSISYEYQITPGFPGLSFTSALYSDRDGFTTPLALFTFNTTDGLDTNIQTVTANLTSNSDFQGLAAGESTEFRMYFADNSTRQSRFHRIHSLQINASPAAIPEPSAAVACILLAGGLATSRIRRR